MAALTPPVCDFDWPAPEFILPATDGVRVAWSEIAGPKGTLIMFICNHCPFVVSVIDHILADVAELQENGIGVAAICSNDARDYPADSFENMALFAQRHKFPCVYLHDEDQSVARAYGAVCTPDFFGFNADGGLQYRGRLGPPRAPETSRDLFNAMSQIARTGQGPRDQIPSMGCSIKWAS